MPMRQVIFLAAVFVLVLVTARCGDDTTSSSTTTDNNYAGPGSKWDVQLTGGTNFVITRAADATAAVSLTINGTYESLTSGFLKLTVTSVTGEGGPSVGDKAYALEVPGYAFILKPLGSADNQIITMVAAGSCPTEDLNANWVMVKKDDDATDATKDFFGTFKFTAATSVPSLPKKYALGSSFADLGTGALTGGTCSNGIMSVDEAVMYLTQNGGAIVHTSPNASDGGEFILGLAQRAITTIGNTDGDYAGLLFDGNGSSGEQVQPVSITCSSGTCTGTIVTDIDNNTQSSDSVTISLTGTPDSLGTGFVTGTITSGSDTGSMVCMMDISVLGTTRKMASCVGQSPGDNTDMFNVLMVSKI